MPYEEKTAFPSLHVVFHFRVQKGFKYKQPAVLVLHYMFPVVQVTVPSDSVEVRVDGIL